MNISCLSICGAMTDKASTMLVSLVWGVVPPIAVGYTCAVRRSLDLSKNIPLHTRS